MEKLKRVAGWITWAMQGLWCWAQSVEQCLWRIWVAQGLACSCVLAINNANLLPHVNMLFVGCMGACQVGSVLITWTEKSWLVLFSSQALWTWLLLLFRGCILFSCCTSFKRSLTSPQFSFWYLPNFLVSHRILVSCGLTKQPFCFEAPGELKRLNRNEFFTKFAVVNRISKVKVYCMSILKGLEEASGWALKTV